jgi:hypothetical protein
MTDLLAPQAHETVLEVGLGYQTAILAELARAVMSVEIVEEFGTEAGARLARLGHRNVEIRIRCILLDLLTPIRLLNVVGYTANVRRAPFRKRPYRPHVR